MTGPQNFLLMGKGIPGRDWRYVRRPQMVDPAYGKDTQTAILVYGSDERFTRSGVAVRPWFAVWGHESSW